MAGLDVVRMTSGDPSLYSALHEQTRRLDAAGVPWDVTPGVPAYAAAAALVGNELTVPLVAQSVVLTRTQARSTAMPERESLAAFAATGATLVLHLAITRTRELMAEIEPFYGADCPVVVVHRATQPGEVVLRGTVGGIADQVEAADAAPGRGDPGRSGAGRDGPRASPGSTQPEGSDDSPLSRSAPWSAPTWRRRAAWIRWRSP